MFAQGKNQLPMSCVRVKRTDMGGVRAHRDHDLRKRDCSHVIPEQTHLNQTLIGSGNAVADVERHVAETGAAIRPNVARPYLSIQLTTSPEWFAGAGEGGVEAWTQATLGHLRARWGDDCVSASLHLDESTPHVHALVCPIHRYTTKTGKERVEVSPRQAIGQGRDALSRLQDEYAWYLEGLGIVRGKKGSTKKHVSTRAWWAQQLHEAGQARDAAVADRAAAAGELEAARSERRSAAAELGAAKAQRQAAARDRAEAAGLLEQARAMRQAAAEMLARAKEQAAAILADAKARAGKLVDDLLDALFALAPEVRNRHRDVVERAERTARAEGVTPSMAERALARVRKQEEATR
jgi:hypothetical protein